MDFSENPVAAAAATTIRVDNDGSIQFSEILVNFNRMGCVTSHKRATCVINPEEYQI
jgi:hypothetical protein